MQDQLFNRKRNSSVFLTAILFIILILITYWLSTAPIIYWPYIFFTRSLFLSLAIILFLRSIPSCITPDFKSSLLIIFWASFLTLLVHLAFMDRLQIAQFLNDIQDHFGLQALLICALFYLILLSVPFVPGVEIGLLIMAAFGKDGVITVYIATVGGLSLAYFFGNFFPHLWKKAGFINFDSLKFPTKKEDAFSESGAPWPHALKLFFSIIPWVIRYRYISLALLINLPGNAIFGGGGGISFISGASGKFKWFWFIGTLMLATLPVPLLVYFGFMEIEKLIQ